MATDIAARTIEVVASHLNREPGSIQPDTALDELGVNSLQLTEIVMDLEDMFEVEIDQNAAEAWASLKRVSDIVAAIETLVSAKA